MKTDRLAKYYRSLAPDERLSLIIAACDREYFEERDRLVESAPRQVVSVPNHHFLAMALDDLAQRYVSRQLLFSCSTVDSSLMQCLLALSGMIAAVMSWRSRQSPTYRLGHELVWGLFQVRRQRVSCQQAAVSELHRDRPPDLVMGGQC